MKFSYFDLFFKCRLQHHEAVLSIKGLNLCYTVHFYKITNSSFLSWVNCSWLYSLPLSPLTEAFNTLFFRHCVFKLVRLLHSCFKKKHFTFDDLNAKQVKTLLFCHLYRFYYILSYTNMFKCVICIEIN